MAQQGHTVGGLGLYLHRGILCTTTIFAYGSRPRQLDHPTYPSFECQKGGTRTKGIVLSLSEKWASGHVCKVKMLSYVGEDEEEDTDVALEGDHVMGMRSYERIYLIYTPWMVVQNLGHSMFLGTIGTTDVTILIDTGSTHDFLHPRIAEQLQLSLTRIRPFRVYVGNNAALICSHVSCRTKLTMQDITFIIDLHILDIHGPDIILGMAWLESLGKVSTDFVGKTLGFCRGDKLVEIQGVQTSPRKITLHSLARLASYSSTHKFYEIIQVEQDSGVALFFADTAKPSFPPETPILF